MKAVLGQGFGVVVPVDALCVGILTVGADRRRGLGSVVLCDELNGIVVLFEDVGQEESAGVVQANIGQGQVWDRSKTTAVLEQPSISKRLSVGTPGKVGIIGVCGVVGIETAAAEHGAAVGQGNE